MTSANTSRFCTPAETSASSCDWASWFGVLTRVYPRSLTPASVPHKSRTEINPRHFAVRLLSETLRSDWTSALGRQSAGVLRASQ
ncbi:protein of unknown function [Micropruina glycogenica]|uniref:Uncharacterized protein n=1 Tax=Micropruina glycogenica TaxID=75385 RepID=A0A2N9JCV3_9ACTN|nr:protein of unknown function [Micropruina glycogenica]